MTQILPIDDPDDPRIGVFRDVRDRDLAGRHDGFIAEGEVVLRVLSRGGIHRATSILIARKRVVALESLLAAFDPSVAIYSADQPVMDAITGFPLHRGILAFGRRAPATSADALLAGLTGPSVILALFGISNHDNIGGIFRNAAAFGAGAVLLDGANCDPLYRKAIRVSVGAVLTIPFARLSADADPLALIEAHGFSPLALSPHGKERLDALVPPNRVAVLLGAEGEGLSKAILARTRTISIPMAAGFDSLNVATTSGIVLHHLVGGHVRRDLPPQTGSPISRS